MNIFEQIIGNYAAAQLRLHQTQPQNSINTRWRMIERALLEYFRELHLSLIHI